ncbi:transporter [Sphingobacteriaceae bacterium]|nr:transporter [Sphingobacteriaceae bacterium]
MIRNSFVSLLLSLLFFSPALAQKQTLTLKDALQKGLENYGSVKAKENYAQASKASVQQSKRDYLPNLVLSAQQDYGTINGQNGPLYGFGGFGVASSGLPLATQNWNAAYGALYLANVNWEFFTFGRTRQRIKISEEALRRDENDLAQEQFQHQVRVASAYLNLIAAQRITRSQQKNLERAIVFKNNAVTRAKNGLIAGVDSSLAAAEVSSARIALTRAKDAEQEQAGRLAVLTGLTFSDFVLDTNLVSRVPSGAAASGSKQHPVLNFYQSRIDLGNTQASYYRRFYFPTFSLFGVVQERGSGFEAGYTTNQTAFTKDYASGVKPVRGNYLLGVGLNWNLTTIVRNSAQVKSQKFMVEALQNEYDLANQQLKMQDALSDAKMKNALDNYAEAPVQVKAASDAYLQKTTLYKNGLATMVEVTQTLYTLNRAETDRDIAFTNVWQALVLKAAATGDITLLTNELH